MSRAQHDCVNLNSEIASSLRVGLRSTSRKRSEILDEIQYFSSILMLKPILAIDRVSLFGRIHKLWADILAHSLVHFCSCWPEKKRKATRALSINIFSYFVGVYISVSVRDELWPELNYNMLILNKSCVLCSRSLCWDSLCWSDEFIDSCRRAIAMT